MSGGRHRVVNPEELGAPKGYANGVVAAAGSRLLFVAGQVGWDRDRRLAGGDFVAQFDRALHQFLSVRSPFQERKIRLAVKLGVIHANTPCKNQCPCLSSRNSQ